MFVRTKKIKNNKYAYLVENTWKKNTSRQKVSKYLGRVHELPDTQMDTVSLEERSYREAALRVVREHLLAIGFCETENKNRPALESDELIFDEHTLTLTHKRSGKPAVIKTYDGYLCDHTLKHLTTLKMAGDEEQTGFALARACVQAGLNVPKPTFVELFERLCPVRSTIQRV